MKNLKCFLNLVLIGLIVLLNAPDATAQVYDLEVVARTGVPLGSKAPVALGTGPSINDFGKVLFIARDTDATYGRVMTLNNGAVEQDCSTGTLASVADEVQINEDY